jgi:putative chitinase
MAKINLSPHFTLEELTVTSTRHDNAPGTKELQALQELCVHVLEPLRALAGGPLHVNSGYRSALVNAACHGSPTSQHLNGEAADIVGSTCTPLELAWLVVDAGLPVDQLIWENTWLHVSYGPKRRGQILTAVFGSGKTKYKSGLPPRHQP